MLIERQLDVSWVLQVRVGPNTDPSVPIVGAMAFEVSSTNDRLKVELTGWDRLLTWRRSLVIERVVLEVDGDMGAQILAAVGTR